MKQIRGNNFQPAPDVSVGHDGKQATPESSAPKVAGPLPAGSIDVGQSWATFQYHLHF
jgi:hypothetical protein